MKKKSYITSGQGATQTRAGVVILYYLCSENVDADQFCSEADLQM